MTEFNFDRASHEMPARSDDFIRSILPDFDEYTGESEAPDGVIVKADVTRDDIRAYVSREGDVWMSERRNFAPGPYLLKQDNNGIVWAMAYDTVEARDADYANAQAAYAEWADDDENEE